MFLVTFDAEFFEWAEVRFQIKETDHHALNQDKMRHAGNLESL